MQRRTVPSPPQANTSSAPSSSARRTCSGAFFAFGTSYQSGCLHAGGLEHAAQLGQPAAEALLGVGDDGDLHATGCARRDVATLAARGLRA